MAPCIWNLWSLWSLFDGPPELKITSLEEFTHFMLDFMGRLCTTCIGGGYITHFSYDFIHSNYDYKAVLDVIFDPFHQIKDVTTRFDQYLFEVFLALFKAFKLI